MECIQSHCLHLSGNDRPCKCRIFFLLHFVCRRKCQSLGRIGDCCQCFPRVCIHNYHSQCSRSSNSWQRTCHTFRQSHLAYIRIFHREHIVVVSSLSNSNTCINYQVSRGLKITEKSSHSTLQAKRATFTF